MGSGGNLATYEPGEAKIQVGAEKALSPFLDPRSSFPLKKPKNPKREQHDTFCFQIWASKITFSGFECVLRRCCVRTRGVGDGSEVRGRFGQNRLQNEHVIFSTWSKGFGLKTWPHPTLFFFCGISCNPTRRSGGHLPPEILEQDPNKNSRPLFPRISVATCAKKASDSHRDILLDPAYARRHIFRVKPLDWEHRVRGEISTLEISRNMLSHLPVEGE